MHDPACAPNTTRSCCPEQECEGSTWSRTMDDKPSPFLSRSASGACSPTPSQCGDRARTTPPVLTAAASASSPAEPGAAATTGQRPSCAAAAPTRSPCTSSEGRTGAPQKIVDGNGVGGMKREVRDSLFTTVPPGTSRGWLWSSSTRAFHVPRRRSSRWRGAAVASHPS